MKLSPFEAQIDWRAYFRSFCETHGGDPVPFRGRLLFRDGWTYSSTDYRGPEWEPPEDPRAYIRAYWLIKLKLARIELASIEAYIAAVTEVAAGRSGQLFRKPRPDEEGPQILTAEPAEARAAFLRQDISNSEVQLCTTR